MVLFSPEILAVAISLIFGAVATLLGLVYRTHRDRLDDVEDDSETNTNRLDEIEQKVETLFSWAFGNERDATDRGISQDIDDNFSELNARLDELDEEIERRHGELVDKFDQLIDELHDEEALEFERDDIE
jgi:tetrahydromethanopterin S-methyltransferase subunit G